ncbi:MAG: hypothetical protein H7228_05815 [Polaromonas sp.]|nr:hypothetical protein [Polaromonas sp.]
MQTPLPSPPPAVNGGSVQQGLSAAYELFAFCLQRFAADKRYSLGHARMFTHLVSPRYTSKKLEPPFYRDVVDVFEDRMRGWVLGPSIQLLKTDPLSVAAITLATNYFEGIEIYHSGEDSKRHSQEFFRRGFQRVFSVRDAEQHVHDYIADALYNMLRCGFAHDSMFRNGINVSTIRPEPIFITYKKKAGGIDLSAPLESVVINPSLFVNGVERHLTNYIYELRRAKDEVLKANFQKAIALKWRLGKPGRLIGLTEEQFVAGEYPNEGKAQEVRSNG